MFSALKKLTHRSPEQLSASGSSSSPSGVSSLNVELQKKFARGVNYNLKLIIRGDRNTGKSCLLKRLQGGEFTEEYIPTDEIQGASIPWSYKATDDIVKVDVWDVVDKAKKRKKMEGLKIGASATNNGTQIDDLIEPALDAEFVDVYKGTHCAVFLFDVTKLWTFEYVQRELTKVPAHIPVLVLGNFIDRQHHRVVTREQASSFVEFFDRTSSAENDAHTGNLKEPAEIRYAESSMRNGFGLRFLHKFLNLPFLMLQKQSLLLQLETNKREIHATQMELDAYQESSEGQYDAFLNNLTQRRRTQAESLAPAPTVDVVVGQPSNTFKELSPKPKQNVDIVKSVESAATAVTSSSKPKTVTPEKSSVEKPTKASTPPELSSLPVVRSSGKLDVDSFVPDQSTIDNFFDEDNSQASNSAATNGFGDDDSDDDANINPMVSGFTDELDLDDFNPAAIAEVVIAHDKASSSDDEANHHFKAKPSETEPKKVKKKVVQSLFQVQDNLSGSILSPSSMSESLKETEANESEEEHKKKSKKKKSKKHRRSSKSPSRERDDLEDFLNGTADESQPPDAAIYEAL